MFSELMKRSNAVWLYSTGRFAEERRRFLCDLVERGRNGWYMLRQTNRLLLAIAERLNVRQRMPVTEQQIERAARDWVSKTSSDIPTYCRAFLARRRGARFFGGSTNGGRRDGGLKMLCNSLALSLELA